MHSIFVSKPAAAGITNLKSLLNVYMLQLIPVIVLQQQKY